MALRITDSAVARTVLRDLEAAETRINRTREQITSGREITRPSDDPYGAGRVLSLRSSLEGARQDRRSIDEALGWVSATETALSSIGDVVLRARDLLVQAGNGAGGAAQRSAIAAELDQLAEAAKTHANASYDGRYVLSGTETSTRPYGPGADTFAGNAVPIYRQIGAGVSVQVGQSAGPLLGNGAGDPDGGLLEVLRTAAAHLRSASAADHELVRTSDLGRLDGVHDAVIGARAAAGSMAARLEAAGDRNDQLAETTARALSGVEDTDFPKALITLNSQQAAYQAALKAGASLIPPSLLDFLR